MKKTPLQKALESHLKTLIAWQQEVFDLGHNFWYCDAQDESHKKPFYYYQINRSENMGTCGNCYKLMELRREIRAIQKQLGLPLEPLYTNFKQEKHVKHMTLRSGGNPAFNPNVTYMGLKPSY